MLLVIFGAGASYDSVPQLRAGENAFKDQYRPPLASQLFENRDVFVPFMKTFGKCRQIIPRLREKSSEIEEELGRIQREADEFPEFHSVLMAILYYIRFVVHRCSEEWERQHSGINNYASLLSEIEHWRFKQKEKVCFVTFNYDTMIEDAMTQVLDVGFKKLDNYISHPYNKLFKLHGSTNWGRILDVDSPQDYNYQRIIRDAAILKPTNTYVVVEGETMNLVNNKLVQPAIAVPIATKSEFACPVSHVEELKRLLPETKKIIMIGWRAMEEHFKALLKSVGPVDLMIVSGDQRGREQTFTNSGITVWTAQNKVEWVDNGFSGLIKQRELLKKFLFH